MSGDLISISRLEDANALLEIDPITARDRDVLLPDHVLARWRETKEGQLRVNPDSLLERCRSLSHPDGLAELNQDLTPWYRIEWCGSKDGDNEKGVMEAIAIYSAKTIEVMPLHEQTWVFGVFSSTALRQSVATRPGLDFDVIENMSRCEARSIMTLLDYVLSMNQWSSKHQRRFHRLIKKIALHFGHHVLPHSFYVQDVGREGEHPVAGGSYADVFKGNCGSQTVCLKRVRVFLGSDREKILQEFLNEAIIWRHLRHPNVLPFLGINQTVFPGETCFISPFIAHGNLSIFLRENPEQDRLPLLYQVAKGLQYLHSTHICHGDVKAANILIDDKRHCFLADFGIATLISTKTATAGFATATSSMKGTMRWMAPELFDYSKTNIDASGIKSAPRDIYAFACTILEIVTGNPPFPEMNDASALLAVIQGQRPPIPASAHMTIELWQLVQKCWAHDPQDRPKSEDVVVDFEKMIPLNNSLLSAPQPQTGFPEGSNLSNLDTMSIKKTIERGEEYEYHLHIRQQPKVAYIKPNVSPIDPPPIVQLRVIDKHRSSSEPHCFKIPTVIGTDNDEHRDLQNTRSYLMFATLAKPQDDVELRGLTDGQPELITGSTVSSLHHIKDPHSTPFPDADADFFVFPDIFVLTEGSFRLKLSLYEVVGPDVRHCKSIYTTLFEVSPGSTFTVLEESTSLSRSLADQGVKIPIRQEVRITRTRSAPNAPPQKKPEMHQLKRKHEAEVYQPTRKKSRLDKPTNGEQSQTLALAAASLVPPSKIHTIQHASGWGTPSSGFGATSGFDPSSNKSALVVPTLPTLEDVWPGIWGNQQF